MKSILIGSASYKTNYQDVDLVTDQEYADWLSSQHTPVSLSESTLAKHLVIHLPDKTIVEVRIPFPNTAHAMLLQQDFPAGTIVGLPVQIAPIPILAALKKAHLIAHHLWEKNIKEYSVLKAKMGVQAFKPSEFGEFPYQLFMAHRQEIKKIVKPHPKLNQSKDAFFEDAEFKIFDHDSIHRAIAIGPQPAYTLMLDGEVWCSKDKWIMLSEEEKLHCVIEESAILALERSVIPALYLNKSYRGVKWAYEFALSKVCTSITSGFFREFAIEHYDQAIAGRFDYSTKFFDGMKTGVVKVLKPEVVGGQIANAV